MHCTVVPTTHRQLWRCNTIIVCRSAMESLGVYLFAGAFCYPAADSRPSCAVQNAPLSAQANGDWPGSKSTGGMLSILWTILIGFIAGVIAKFVTPGSTYEPKGFILTTP